LGEFLSTAFFHTLEELSNVNWSFLLGQVGLTLKMAFLGTLLGFFLSVPLAVLSADGITTGWISKPVRFLLLVIRSVPALIWALIFVAALGLGAVSGTLALAVYSVGYLTKLLYEGIEELDRKPFEAIRGLGASRFQAIRFALLPTAKPLFLGSLVFMLEYNVRSASLLGLVGAGGIGQDLMASLEWRDFPTLTAILGLILAAVLVFDQISVQVRRYLRKELGI
jgi:phosphonate transport system permease protein